MIGATDFLRAGVLIGVLLIATGARAEPVIKGNTIENVRDARYCEIIPIVRDGFHLTATVYNTLGLSDCPAATWNAITEDAMKQRFDALTVLLNGPRYFIMDSIEASGAPRPGKTGRQPGPARRKVSPTSGLT